MPHRSSTFPVRIPRHACSPRDSARSGELWRLVQELAILHSTERGWPPSRYRVEGTGFVVREILGVHTREALYGEELVGRTWVADTRRGVLMRRESRIEGVLAASAEWVHVGPVPGLDPVVAMSTGQVGPVRGSAALLDAFPAGDAHDVVRLPAVTPADPRPLPAWELSPWWTEMDPMGHTNHPRYVDFADEAVSRWLHAEGVDPIGLVPVAERIRFRAGARAGETVRIEGARVGWSGDAAAFHLKMWRGDELVADATLIRAHLAGPSALAR